MTSRSAGPPEPKPVVVYHGEELSRYGFGHGHPFGSDRQEAFWSELTSRGLVAREDDGRIAAPLVGQVRRQRQVGIRENPFAPGAN